MLYPFECSRCRKRIYSPSKRFAKCCEDASMIEMVNICYMIAHSAAPSHTVVHTVPEKTPLPAASGTKCVTACNAKTKPKFSASHHSAVTCKKCLEWIESRQLKQTIKNERKFILEALEGVVFVDEDDPTNSFRSKIEEVKNINVDDNMIQDPKKLLETLRNLHENKNFRNILQQRKQLLQELDSK